jgi:molybdopterin-binding protein
VTVVYVTHDQDEALVVADRIAIMNAGRIVAHGSTDDVIGIAQDEWTASFLGLERAAEGTVIDANEGLCDVEADGVVVTLAGEIAVGSRVLFAVRPEDVLLFEAGIELPATTARNRLAAQVVSVEPRGTTLRVTMNANGVRLASSVSRASASELGLAEGTRVLAVFKATAVRWRLIEDREDSGRHDAAGDGVAGSGRFGGELNE